jgi:hypothetical protein
MQLLMLLMTAYGQAEVSAVLFSGQQDMISFKRLATIL